MVAFARSLSSRHSGAWSESVYAKAQNPLRYHIFGRFKSVLPLRLEPKWVRSGKSCISFWQLTAILSGVLVLGFCFDFGLSRKWCPCNLLQL